MSKIQHSLPKDHHHHLSKVTTAGLLVTLGIIFGDIGTSPLYVLSEVIGNGPINKFIIKGVVSCIFWTLTLQTTLKYVVLTLRADNKGEGGIFSLYALVRRTKKKWLLFPAIIGGSTLLADGIITPPISVASSIEGLRNVMPHIETIPIVIGILVGLFFIQQFGTSAIGKLFGPIMLVWFLMLGVLGSAQVFKDLSIIGALNPYYAFDLLAHHPGGFLLLGAVFLCTTGAEALYSDLGHCGKSNIRVSWIFVKTCLVLNYLGQAAWLIAHDGEKLGNLTPFYAIIDPKFLPIAIGIATSAAIVASQALISGSFTLINEAIRLNFWPKVKIVYPTNIKGQLYIPSVNWLLCAGCVAIVLYFKESSAMAAAYGLAIVLTMLMTTSLLTYFMILKRYSKIFIFSCLAIYVTIETSFLIANMHKFKDGGWVTLMIASCLVTVMWVWYEARRIKNRYVEFVELKDYLKLITDLSKDLAVPKYATHLVYLTSADNKDEIEAKVIYSILQKQPKRADIYWLVHVDVVDEPYRMDYVVQEIIPNDVIRVDFRLGFRVAPRINLLFRKVVQDLVTNKEVDITSRYESLNKSNVIGDFMFVVMEKFLSADNELPIYEKLILKGYFILKEFSISEERAFGLDTSSVKVEKVPMVITTPRETNLKRIYPRTKVSGTEHL
ncbi:MAG: KUP/HAK/KT family potassium transporter [Bacteroidia bacterium]